MLPLLLLDLWMVFHVLRKNERQAHWQTAVATTTESQPPLPPPVPWAGLTYPTDRRDLLDLETLRAYQPTASGRPSSGLFGSVRTGQRGNRLLPTFHEGIDIAALNRDARGRPLDAVYAAADGVVAHANRVGGNSNYGIYVVLLHDDPLGQIYTLYAHLAELAPEVKAGKTVAAGETLGRMGNTSSSPMPMERGHLHFEIGMVMNSEFHRWYRARKLKPDHGNYHGWNLLGVDPMEFLRFQQGHPGAPFGEFLAGVPEAFEVALAASRKPDFFARYPGLWSGEEPTGAVVLSCSENGVPLRGRAATAEEKAALGGRKHMVRQVNPSILERNGRRLVVEQAGDRTLGKAGEEWRDILLYPN